MENDKLKNYRAFINNPLGIIGLFLVLVDGIAAIVIIKSQLTYSLNLIIVLFIVIFPILVLFVFYLLVTNHHNKLYSPSDYKDEKNFISTFNPVLQKTVGIPIDEYVRYKSEGLDKIKQFSEVVENLEIKVNEVMNNNVKESKGLEIIKEELKSTFEHVKDNRYIVLINKDSNNVKDLTNKLLELGIHAEIYKPKSNVKNNDKHESIWLGKRVPLNMAKQVIETAYSFCPELKYIYISGDKNQIPDFVNDQMFIKGSTNSSNEYGLRSLNAEDFAEVQNFQSLDQLHNYIRSFYN